MSSDKTHNPAFPPPNHDQKPENQPPVKTDLEKRNEARGNVDEANAKNFHDRDANQRPNKTGAGPVTMTGDKETPLPEGHAEDKDQGRNGIPAKHLDD